MIKEKIKFFFFSLPIILILLLNGCNALSFTNNYSGPLDVSFSLTIEIDSTNPQSGQHLMPLILTVEDFANATSLNSTEIWLSIRDYGTEYYSLRIILGNFTLSENTFNGTSYYNYFSSWGEVRLMLQVRYIYCNASYTSDVLYTNWITYANFHTYTPFPTNPNPNPSSGWGRIAGYIILSVFSLIGSVGYYSNRSRRRSSSVTEVDHQVKKESKEGQKLETKLSPISTYCSYCGNKTEPNDRLCLACGMSIKKS